MSSNSNAVANGLAGAGGGIVAQIITYPLQTVNTRQQTERIDKKKKQPHSPSERSSSGTLLQIFQVVRSEGWGGLYSGLKPSLLGTAASQGIYYYFYQVFKNKAEAIAAARKAKGLGDGTVGMFSWLAVAAIAGSLNVLLTIPIWVLVTRMQTQTQAERKIIEGKKQALLREASESSSIDSTLQEKLADLDSMKPHPYGTLQAAREVYSEAGIIGFWKGIIPTLIMVSLICICIIKCTLKLIFTPHLFRIYECEVCNPSIQFMIYESSLKHLRAKRFVNKQVYKNVTALESRLQAKQEIGGNNLLRYTGTLDAIVKMIRYEGLTGFYKGMSTKIVQSVFAASVLFMIKEELVKAFTVLADKSKKLLISLNN